MGTVNEGQNFFSPRIWHHAERPTTGHSAETVGTNSKHNERRKFERYPWNNRRSKLKFLQKMNLTNHFHLIIYTRSDDIWNGSSRWINHVSDENEIGISFRKPRKEIFSNLDLSSTDLKYAKFENSTFDRGKTLATDIRISDSETYELIIDIAQAWNGFCLNVVRQIQILWPPITWKLYQCQPRLLSRLFQEIGSAWNQLTRW